ncbi:MAG: HAD family phosphatase [Parasphingorhabdus sp.]
MTIRNVVFDIGNVIVKWDPHNIVERTFGADRTNVDFVQSIFPGNNVWLPLNKGEITAEQAMQRYRDQYGFSEAETDKLWQNVLASMDLIPGTIELMDQLQKNGYRLFALSDNVHEIVTYLKSEYDFWPRFEGAVVSAEVALLKPDPQIYRHLLDSSDLNASETVFMDDMPKNVDGAQSVGMAAIQFSTVDQAKHELIDLGLNLG